MYQNQKGIAHLIAIVVVLVLLAAGGVGLFFFLNPGSQLKTESLTDVQLAKKTFDFRYSELEKSFNEKNYDQVYSEFLNSTQKTDTTIDQFKNTLNQFYSLQNVKSVKFLVHSVTPQGNLALVDRTVEYCLTDDCSEKSSERSTVLWIRENLKWVTAQEAGLCPRDISNPNSFDQNMTSLLLGANGIQTSWQIQCEMFPTHWYINTANNNLEPLDKLAKNASGEDLTRVINVVSNTLQSYPRTVLFNVLRGVHIVDSLNFNGVDYYATNSKSRIYLTVGPEMSGYTQAEIKSAIYMSLGKMLLEKYPEKFNKTAFMKVKYKGTKSLTQMNTLPISPLDQGVYVQGFLNGYGGSSFEEDFDTYVAYLFSGNRDFWNELSHEDNQTIKEKAALVIEFFNRVDSTFTEDYFKAIADNNF